MVERLFVEKPRIDCRTLVSFPQPGDATCPSCGTPMFMNEKGQVGRYPQPDWQPGGIQGRRPKA
jgi:hypothetical protein